MNPGTKETLRTLLKLDTLSIDYGCKLDPPLALCFVACATAYNGFTRRDLVRLIRGVNAAIPRMDFGQAHPNTGCAHHGFRIGNEGSRVIYVEVSKSYLTGWGTRDYRTLAQTLADLGRRANADEADVRVDNQWSFTYRFWWD